MAAWDANSEELLRRVREGDEEATQFLLQSYRHRLRQMIALRLDERLAPRLDASDVVQETLAEAARKLPEYLESAPLPIYPWLRRIAAERLAKLHRRHLAAQKRSAAREQHFGVPLPDKSANILADHLVASGTSPSQRALRAEQLDRVRVALAQLPENDREVLVMRYLEQLSNQEIAAVMDVTEAVVKTRHVRALARVRRLLTDLLDED
jgi:RNA polymerase sigma-70 factor (ECF subfamily)